VTIRDAITHTRKGSRAGQRKGTTAEIAQDAEASAEKGELRSIPLPNIRDLCTANVLVLVFLRGFSDGKVVVVRKSNRDRIDP